MFVCVVSLSQPSSIDLLYVKCLSVLSRYLSPVVEICCMLNVYVCCLVITARQQRSVISQMRVCVVPLSQPGSRDPIYAKCVRVLSRYLNPAVEICYMENVCVCCLVISTQQQRSVVCQMVVCVVSLSQPSSRDLLYVKCLCVVSLSQHSSRNLLCVKCLYVLSRYLSLVVEICYMLNVSVCVVSLSQPSRGDL